MELTTQANLTSEHRIIMGLQAAGLCLGILTIFLVPPANLPLPACVFRSITGHSCLTCGMTRSLHAISHGELAASLRYHMLGPVVFLGVLLGFMTSAAEAISGKLISVQWNRKWKVRFLVPFAIIWLIYWSVRLIVEYMR